MASTGRPWELRAGEIASLLGIDEPELYRRVYAATLGHRPVLDLSVATGAFGPDNMGELVSLLELFYGPAAERELEQAGLFLTHERRVDVLEAFLSVASRRLSAHVVDARKFSAMLRAFGKYETARDAYLRELPSVDDLVRDAAAAFCGTRSFGIPELARGTVESTLRMFLRRKVLAMDAVLASLLSRLHAQAVREGYVRTRPRPAQEGPAGQAREELVSATAERERALRMLELSGRKPTPELLRSQYRRLMKRYHPDVNPAGLERSKEINVAYGLLVAALEG
jgi:hypothetical protein